MPTDNGELWKHTRCLPATAYYLTMNHLTRGNICHQENYKAVAKIDWDCRINFPGKSERPPRLGPCQRLCRRNVRILQLDSRKTSLIARDYHHRTGFCDHGFAESVFACVQGMDDAEYGEVVSCSNPNYQLEKGRSWLL
jgi:hypothetical protein